MSGVIVLPGASDAAPEHEPVTTVAFPLRIVRFALPGAVIAGLDQNSEHVGVPAATERDALHVAEPYAFATVALQYCVPSSADVL